MAHLLSSAWARNRDWLRCNSCQCGLGLVLLNTSNQRSLAAIAIRTRLFQPGTTLSIGIANTNAGRPRDLASLRRSDIDKSFHCLVSRTVDTRVLRCRVCLSECAGTRRSDMVTANGKGRDTHGFQMEGRTMHCNLTASACTSVPLFKSP
jgi:hypothetical protein